MEENLRVGEGAAVCPDCSSVMIYNADMRKLVCECCNATQDIDLTAHEAAQENDYDDAQDAIEPSHLIPFMLGEETARASLADWIKRKWLVPRKLKRMATHGEMSGVYYPYWTYDAQTSAKYIANSGKNYTATVQAQRMENNKIVTYNTTEKKIKWVRVSGNYQFFADDVLINATREDMVEICRRVEPFDHSALIPYDPRLLAGYRVEADTVGLADGLELAKKRIEQMALDGIDDEVRRVYRADEVDNIRFSTGYDNVKYKHILLPLWVSTYTYRGKNYHYVVNGQTGKADGDTPSSPLKIGALALLCAAAAAALIYLWWYLR